MKLEGFDCVCGCAIPMLGPGSFRLCPCCCHFSASSYFWSTCTRWFWQHISSGGGLCLHQAAGSCVRDTTAFPSTQLPTCATSRHLQIGSMLSQLLPSDSASDCGMALIPAGRELHWVQATSSCSRWEQGEAVTVWEQLPATWLQSRHWENLLLPEATSLLETTNLHLRIGIHMWLRLLATIWVKVVECHPPYQLLLLSNFKVQGVSKSSELNQHFMPP